MYFTMFIIFLVLIIGPIVASKFIGKIGIGLPMQLLQPTGQNNNDTSGTITGARINNAGGPAGTGAAAGGSGTASASGASNTYSTG